VGALNMMLGNMDSEYGPLNTTGLMFKELQVNLIDA
jgi:hypothetical protein